MKKDVGECEKKGEASKHSARGGKGTTGTPPFPRWTVKLYYLEKMQ
jgi:hypothetical protein